jgi:type II secretion system protein H
MNDERKNSTAPAFIVHRSAFSVSIKGFTLIELIVVMIILAIVSAVVVPSLTSFRIGRANNNTAMQLVGLAQYARTQAVAEGRTYRLNFDLAQGQFWLTAADDTGVYQPASGDYAQRISIADGARMDVNVNPQPNTQMTIASTVQQNAVQLPPAVADPQVLQPNTLMQNARQQQDGLYVEFQPSGRTDPGLIKLTDRQGSLIEVGCLSATETFHVLSASEMQ